MPYPSGAWERRDSPRVTNTNTDVLAKRKIACRYASCSQYITFSIFELTRYGYHKSKRGVVITSPTIQWPSAIRRELTTASSTRGAGHPAPFPARSSSAAVYLALLPDAADLPSSQALSLLSPLAPEASRHSFRMCMLFSKC